LTSDQSNSWSFWESTINIAPVYMSTFLKLAWVMSSFNVLKLCLCHGLTKLWVGNNFIYLACLITLETFFYWCLGRLFLV
jgi:hypothetical protein